MDPSSTMSRQKKGGSDALNETLRPSHFTSNTPTALGGVRNGSVEDTIIASEALSRLLPANRNAAERAGSVRVILR